MLKSMKFVTLRIISAVTSKGCNVKQLSSAAWMVLWQYSYHRSTFVCFASWRCKVPHWDLDHSIGMLAWSPAEALLTFHMSSRVTGTKLYFLSYKVFLPVRCKRYLPSAYSQNTQPLVHENACEENCWLQMSLTDMCKPKSLICPSEQSWQ